MKLLMIFTLFAMSLVATANDRGNGGDAVVCRDENGEIISAELLDYYEGRTLRKMEVIHPVEESNAPFIREMIARIDGFESFFKPFEEEAIDMDEALKEFREKGESSRENMIFTNDPLTDIPDSDELILKKGCKVEQLAIRVHQRFPEDPKFIFQADILKKLSEKDVRGLVLHEMIYGAFLERASSLKYEMTSSVIARYFHQKLMTQDLGKTTFFDYALIMRHLYKIRKWTDEAFIKKGGLNLGINIFIPGANGKLRLLDIRQGLAITVNNDGSLDYEDTRKNGILQIKTYQAVKWSNMPDDIGTINLAVGAESHNLLLFPHGEHWSHVKLGEWMITLKLNPSNSSKPIRNAFGVKYGKYDNIIPMEVTMKNKPMTVVKKVSVDIDENFQVVVKEL